MADWEKLLGKKVADAKAPPPFPVGTYTLQVGEHRFDESSKKKTPFVEFSFKVHGADDDVDKEALAELGDLSKKTPRSQFYLTDDADFLLRDFLEACGCPIGGGRTFAEAIPDTKGCFVKGYMIQEPLQHGEGMRSRIQRFAKVEDE